MNTLKTKKNITLNVPCIETKSNQGQTEDDDIVLKPVYSAKNLRKSSSHFSFDPNNIAVCTNARKHKKLEKNNQVLYRSLIALKTGAVQAIAAKQEEIEALKNSFKIEEELQNIEDELHELYEERDSLKDEVKELEQKLESQRQGFFRMLEEKERLIEELYAQLGSAQLEIQNLEKFEVINEKKLKIIQEENQNLFQQLQFEKIAHLGQQSTVIESDEPHYIFQTVQQEGTHQNMDHQKNVDHSFESQKIKQMEQKHKEQLQELCLFYEKRLTEVRNLYQRQLQETSNCLKLPQQSLKRMEEEYSVSIKDTIVSPNKLSQQLFNFPKLSQCYSITKKNLSKADSLSMFSSDNMTPFESDGKLKNVLAENLHKKRVTFTVKERDEEYKTQVTSPRKGRQTERTILLENVCEKSEKSNPIDEKKLDTNSKIGSFLFGALTGGVMTAALCSLLRR